MWVGYGGGGFATLYELLHGLGTVCNLTAFIGTVLLVVKVNTLTFDPFKLIYLRAECVYVSYDAWIP